ncbi:MAG TPA: hypothetical protein PLU30_27240 [Verrucomicrobiae bacterium]|nr:hypothetical protein [Verrucomicrobiae bacterium]
MEPTPNPFPPAPPTPGWKTSEFWAFAAISLVAVLNKAFDWHIPDQAVGMIAGCAAAYALSRGIAKRGG